MKWTSINNYKEMSRFGAEILFEAIFKKVKAEQPVNVGLATGNTMLELYVLLAEMLNKSELDLTQLSTFNLDEYVGNNGKNIDRNHSLSYQKYITDNFFNLIDPACGLKRENMFFPNAEKPAAYDALIATSGGLDIQLLGIGFNGHIAFNEPISETEISKEEFALLPSRIIELDELTIKTNAQLTAQNNLNAVPQKAVTMGMATILEAKEILLLACFAEQATPLQAIKSGNVTSELPASFLLLHDNTEIVYTEDKINTHPAK